MNLITRLSVCIISLVLLTSSAFSQNMDRIEREGMKEILSGIKNAVKKNYYDPNYHGIDLDDRFKKAEDRLDQVTSTGQAFAVIAQVLVDFNDSHLFFSPPGTTAEVQYGFQVQMVGDRAFVTRVKPKSDAAAKGLMPGDQILSFEGFKPTRKELWKMVYYYYTLSPRTKIRLSVLKPGSETPVDLEVAAKVTTKKRSMNLENTQDYNDLVRESDDAASRAAYYITNVGNVAIWRLLTFSIDPTQVNPVFDSKVKGKQTLILDLRGNGGGYVDTLAQIAGNVFDKDIKIADRKGRPDKKKENEPMTFKSRKDESFSGKIIVLIDSQSASASEIFARFVQLEKRGVVLGDVSSGAVMQSIFYPMTISRGMDKEAYYGVSITNADVIMSDGKSVEHVGVVPDEFIIPSAEDLHNERDPVLARAMELAGIKATPAEAWKLFEKANKWEN